MKTGSMTLSLLIKELEEVLAKNGDMPVAAKDNGDGYWSSHVFWEVLPPYYDGGYIYPVEPTPLHAKHWKRSRTAPEGMFLKIRSGYPESDEGDTIDGVEVKEELP